MKLSHRDLRADGAVARAFGTLLAIVAALSVLAFLVPWSLVGLAALVALGIAGGIFVMRSERIVAEYLDDLDSARSDDEVRRWARAEMASEIPLEGPVGLPSLRSPHTRGPGGPGPARAPTSPATD
jgi:hypothetical protein